MRNSIHILLLINLVVIQGFCCTGKGDTTVANQDSSGEQPAITVVEGDKAEEAPQADNAEAAVSITPASEIEEADEQVTEVLPEKPAQVEQIEVAEAAEAAESEPGQDSSTSADNMESTFDQFFKAYVEGGKVDYRTLRSKSAELEMIQLAVASTELASWSDSQIKSFRINTYNFLVIHQVVSNMPINSPLDVDGFFKAVQFNVAGKLMTLSELEDELRDDPRIHLALVCAAEGCPRLRAAAYRNDDLDLQLTNQTAQSMNDPQFTRVSDSKVQLSRIFDWYADDFGGPDAIIPFVNSYRSTRLPAEPEISFYTYDWTLNAR